MAESSKVNDSAKVLDGFDNFVSRLGINNDNALSAGTYEFNLVTRNRIKLEAAYRGSWIVGAAIDSIPEDMTRAGINVTTNEDATADIKDLKNAISRLQISQAIAENLKWGSLYGGSLGILQIDGQKLDTPLDLDTIAKDQFKGITVMDRWQLNPDLTRIIDSGPDMGLPKYYQIVNVTSASNPSGLASSGGAYVHYSRVIRSIGIKLPYFQAITENMWGESKLERMWDRLISFDNATMSAASLIDRANLRMVGVEGLREILAAGGEATKGLYAMFEMMRSLQVNEGLTLLDKNDEFQTTAYSFAGLPDMLLQFGQQISGAVEIPLIRLFGQAPAGLGATGEGDIRMYYDRINAKQEAQLRNPWELILKVLWRSVYGRPAPKDLEFTFVPLWQMTAKDKSDIAKSNTETIIGAYEAGLTKRSTAMKELRGNSGESGLFSNITDEDIAEAEETDDDPPPGELEMPGLSVNGKTLSKEDSEAEKKPEPAKTGDARPRGFLARLLGK